MKKRGVLFLGVLAFIVIALLVLGASATITYSSNQIEKNYYSGEKIKGKINFSFIDESSDTLLTSNFPGNIEVLELIKKSNFEEGNDYTCNINGCGSTYTETGKINSLSLSAGESSFIGFKITGNDVSVTSIKVDITSNVAASCFRQLNVDVLGEDDKRIQSIKHNGQACTFKHSGCFDSSLASYDLATITSTKYCQKINVPPAPALKLGGRIKNSTAGQSDITLGLYDLDYNFIEGCVLPRHSADNEDLECLINYTLLEEKENYICVSAGGGDYKLRFEQSGETCGTDDFGSSDESDYDIDYGLYVKTMMFDSSTISVSENTFSKFSDETLVQTINDYVIDKFEKNCVQGCLIPFEIIGDSQNLNFANAEIKYNRGNTASSSTDVYDIEKEAAKISSTKQLLLDISKAEFEIPVDTNEKSFKLYSEKDGSKNLLFEENINISKGFTFNVAPRFALIGVSTEFEIITAENVTSTLWNFGDGKTANSNNKKVIHSYETEGEYDAEVTAVRKDGLKVTKKFKILVGDPKESAEVLIPRYKNRLANITLEINEYPQWVRDEIKKKINVQSMNISLSEIEDDFKAAKSDSEYTNVVNSLIDLDVPYSVVSAKSGTLPMSIGFSEIDLSYIEQASGESITLGKEDEVRLSLSGWFNKYYNSQIDFESVSAFKDSGEQELLTRFDIEIRKKGGSDKAYLIIGKELSELQFLSNYGAQRAGLGTAIELGTFDRIQFVAEGEVDIKELGAYISPGVSALGTFEDIGFIERVFPFGFFFIWIILLILITLIAYIILQEWYKRYYESYLFKNQNQLYNLINFIYNARKSGITDSEIKKKLLKAGWKGEQIRYAFRKIDGKRTGMWEIPIFKFFEDKRVKEEISKRHQGAPVDARFIKRPTF